MQYKIREHMVICCLNISTRPLSFVSRPLSYVSSDDLILVSDIIPKVALWAKILSKLRALEMPGYQQIQQIPIPLISISYPFHIRFISIHPVKEGNMMEHVWDQSSWSLATSFAIPQNMLCSRYHTISCHKLPIICTCFVEKHLFFYLMSL